MVIGLYQDLKIVVSSFGIRKVRLYNVSCRDIKIQVEFLLSLFLLSLFPLLNFFLLVISVDLSPAGDILATGSGDWQARICMFLLHSFYFYFSVAKPFFLCCRALHHYLSCAFFVGFSFFFLTSSFGVMLYASPVSHPFFVLFFASLQSLVVFLFLK
jgi:hypothetical protein